MGDLANMTNYSGYISADRLLRWLRSKAEVHGEAEATAREMSEPVLVAWNSSRRHLLEEMAEDLERELTPPDHPGDDDEFTFLGIVDTGTCEGCGKPADGDTVDMDDPAFLGRPEQE